MSNYSFNGVSRGKALPPRIIRNYQVDTSNLNLNFSEGGQKYPTYREFMRLLPVLRDNPSRNFDVNDILGVFFTRKNENDRAIIFRRIESALADGLLYVAPRTNNKRRTWLEYQLTDYGVECAEIMTGKL